MKINSCNGCKHNYSGLVKECVKCNDDYSEWNDDDTEKVTEDDSISTRTKALYLIDTERNNQDRKWGEQNHAQTAWASILGEEFGEYCQAVNETYLNNATEQHKGGYQNLLTELTHVAAVAVGAIECLMRNKGEK